MTDTRLIAIPDNVDETVARAIAEDLGDGDITAQLIAHEKKVTATITCRDDAVLCGTPWADEVCRQIDTSLSTHWSFADGDQIDADTIIGEVTGSARSILTAERTMLNFVQTLSATATQTRELSRLIEHTETRLLDTRKTLPGLRLAQKYAVLCGGGMNHRIGLFDAFLIKENHIAASGGIANAIANARQMHPDRRLEIEVESLQQFAEAVHGEPDWIMLDNFSLSDMKTAVDNLNKPIKLEASGGIESGDDLIKIAETGVDYISVGALTKHVHAVDLSMLIV
ncbi:MAG: carboxylating nicotinate-nucleotide diphosphorylase [Pseudomonadota bacterium]